MNQNHHIEAYERILSSTINWAKKQHDINTIIVLGSRARHLDKPADEWSDLDLAIFCDQPEKYLHSPTWLESIGEYWLTFLEETAVGGGLERRVLFKGARDVDFAFFSVEHIPNLLDSPETINVLERGYRIVLDRNNYFHSLIESRDKKISHSPDDFSKHNTIHADQFHQLIQDYLYHAVLAIKKLMRSEVWQAKSITDHYLKRELLQLIEWHAKSKHGEGYDTWHDGRFLDLWADSKILEKLPSTFATYDRVSIISAVFHSIELMSEVAQEIATRHHFEYPLQEEQEIVKWIKQTV